MSNIFETAEVVGTTKAKTKADKKIQMTIEGIEMLARIKVVKESLEALNTLADNTAEAQMLEYFIEKGYQDHKRPDNFRGVEGEATASCELQIRGERSKLSDMEIALAKEHNIPIETVWDVADTAIINPVYAKDNALLLRVSTALEKVKDLPKDFIQIQKGNPKTVANEAAMNAVFKLTDKNLMRKLLPAFSILAKKPKLNSSDPETIQRAFDSVLELLGQIPKEPATTARFKKGK